MIYIEEKVYAKAKRYECLEHGKNFIVAEV